MTGFKFLPWSVFWRNFCAICTIDLLMCGNQISWHKSSMAADPRWEMCKLSSTDSLSWGREYNSFVYEQVIVSYVKTVSNVVPILSKDIFSASQSRFLRNWRAGAYSCLFGLQLQGNWLLVLFDFLEVFPILRCVIFDFCIGFVFDRGNQSIPRLTHGWPQIEDEFRTLWVFPYSGVSPPVLLYSGPGGWHSFCKFPSFLSKTLFGCQRYSSLVSSECNLMSCFVCLTFDRSLLSWSMALFFWYSSLCR